MTVYRYFIKIALRNKGVILTYTIIFFIFAIISTWGTTVEEENFMEVKLDIGIVDNSNSQVSESLRGYLSDRHNIVEVSWDIDDIRDQVFLQVVDAVIIIAEDFENRIIKGEKAVEVYRDKRKMESLYIQSQLNKYFKFLNASYEDGSFNIYDTEEALRQRVRVDLVEGETGLENSAISQWFSYYSNFTGYIIIAVYIAVMGLVMAEFTDENVDNRRKIAYKRLFHYNREIYLGQLSLASMISFTFILGGLILGGKDIGEINLAIYLTNMLVFSFSILCLTFLINNITRDRFVINGISTVLSLGTSFISGVMVGQEFLSPKVLALARFFPLYYFVRVNNMQAIGLFDIKYEIFMQFLFGVAFLATGLYLARVKEGLG